MITRHHHRMAAAAAIAPMLVLTACATTVGGTGEQGTGVPTTSTPTTATPTTGAPSTGASSTGTATTGSTGSNFPTDVAGLAALLAKGKQSTKSAHIVLEETVAGSGFTGSGDERLADGKVVAIDLTETIPSAGTVRYRIIGATVFAQLPDTLYKSSKPWVQISATTTDSVLKHLYTSFQSATQSGAGDTVRLFVAAAKNLKQHGTETFDADQVEHYSLAVDVPSLPADFPNRDALEQSGLTSIPVDLYVDALGRPRKVTEDFTLSGQRVTADVSLTKIDVPVTITAPPADQVEQA